jgi:hypothetical protein
MAGEEVRLVGDRAFEPSADVDIEVTDRVSLELPVWRCTCGLEHESGRGHLVIVGDAEQDRTADRGCLASGSVAPYGQRDSRCHSVGAARRRSTVLFVRGNVTLNASAQSRATLTSMVGET